MVPSKRVVFRLWAGMSKSIWAAINDLRSDCLLLKPVLCNYDALVNAGSAGSLALVRFRIRTRILKANGSLHCLRLT